MCFEITACILWIGSTLLNILMHNSNQIEENINFLQHMQWGSPMVRDLSKQFWCLVEVTENSIFWVFKLNLHKMLF